MQERMNFSEMNRIVLQNLEERDESLIPGETVGEILIGDGGSVEVIVSDDDIKSRIEALISRGLTVLSGDSSGLRSVTYAHALTPDDPRFARALIERLEQKDFRLTGTLPR
jgi:hypothetical protein